MSHLGLICPELSGHLNPMTTLGRELQRRGHRVTLIARPDGRAKAEAAGLGFAVIGEKDFPIGAMKAMSAELGAIGGLRAIRFTVEMLRKAARTVLEEAPAVIEREEIDALLIDQVTPAGNTVAERLGRPWVNVCNALAMNPEPAVPPGVLPWRYDPSWLGRMRNRAGNALLHRLAHPVIAEINRHRTAHGLPAITGGLTAGSPFAQIAQQPACFDFPRRELPAHFHYTGPWHDARSGDPVPFPWEQLDSRPLIYASMGTLQNRQSAIFENIAGACAGLPAQLVISLGSRDQDAAALAARFPGHPIVVSFAPQLQLLKRATLAITHAGLNTALESLSLGLPMVAIPITNDQPGVASRLAWLGVAEVVQPGELTVPRLRAALEKVLAASSYREKARQLGEKIRALDGLPLAADLVEEAFAKASVPPVARR
jgi:MGT family glycosyltransferase